MPKSSFDYSPGNRLIFGPGTLERLGSAALDCGGTTVLLVTDAGLKQAGHEERAVRQLEQAGLKVCTYDDVNPNPTTLDIERGCEFARPLGIDLIIGLGGGSSMDCAKGINFLLTNGGKMQDYRGTGKATKPMLPMIAIPTTSGTGSEAQSYAVISDAQTHMKMACGDKKALPRISILDPELTVTMPRSVTSATGIDALSHALETAVTRDRHQISSLFSHQAWQLIIASLETVLLEPSNISARGDMLLGAYFAGTAIENSMLGATHALANPLSAHFELTHGTAIGVMLPYVVQFNSKEPEARKIYSSLAKQAGLADSSSEDPVQSLVRTLRKLIGEVAGQPLTLKDCGVDKELFPQMAEEAALQWTGQFNPRTVTTQLLLEIYKCAFDGTDVTF